jgi:succinate dehydrogenase/fumarate reductase flavoprotein subunit
MSVFFIIRFQSGDTVFLFLLNFRKGEEMSKEAKRSEQNSRNDESIKGPVEESKMIRLSRRNFIKGAAVVAGGEVLMSCAPKVAGTPQPTAGADQQTAVPNTPASQKLSYEIPPAPIPENQITSTVTADIIVVGAGTAGLVCANSAAENGAKVVLISASKGNVARGGSNHAMNSKVMQKLNVPIEDPDTWIRKELAAAGYNVDQDKWWKFAKYSEEAVNWLIDKMEAAGYQTVLEIGNTDPKLGPMFQPVGSHSWINKDMQMAGAGQQFVVDTLAKTAQASGVQIIYKMVAEQLVREDNNTGRVTAVIAKGDDGKYVKYMGTKAIVLATGDFSADKEMMTKYCPTALPLLFDTGSQGYDTGIKWGGIFKGDGQKMGLWVGAAWQKTFPNCPMISAKQAYPPQNEAYGFHRGLLLNKMGRRYGNEDVNQSFAGLTQYHQPEMKIFAIWDSDYANAAAPWHTFGMKYGDDPVDPQKIVENWEKQVKAGTLVKADTIEEVIKALSLPADATKAAVDRYNELCDKGVDEDFFKRKELLIPIIKAPFYGVMDPSPDFLTVLGGLRTDINMQVCDENDNPIPGLYNIGTMVGDFWGNIYNFLTCGGNLGANCVTFGYTTGRDIAKGTTSPA